MDPPADRFGRRLRFTCTLENPMRKIKLDLDALRIDSFATGGDVSQRGTVHGRATEFVCSWLPTCPGQATCGAKTCAC